MVFQAYFMQHQAVMPLVFCLAVCNANFALSKGTASLRDAYNNPVLYRNMKQEQPTGFA